MLWWLWVALSSPLLGSSLEIPPFSVIQMPASLNVAEGSTLSMTCSIKGSISTNWFLKWYKKEMDRNVEIHNTGRTHIVNLGGFSHLTLETADIADSGLYVCMAGDAEFPSVSSKGTQLTVNGLAESSGGDKASEEVTGVLGESVTFYLRTTNQIKLISWLKNQAGGLKTIAFVKPKQPCELQVILPELRERIKVSKDCKMLEIMNLCQDDSGIYTALIQIPKASPEEEIFNLDLYKRLVETDLEVYCAKVAFMDGNQTWHVNCSARNWEDSMGYHWTSARKSDIFSLGKSLVIQDNEQDNDDLNITCTAQNLVGNATKTFSFKQACDRNPTNGQPSKILLGVAIAMLIVAKVIISMYVFLKLPSCIKRDPKTTGVFCFNMEREP